MLFRCIKSENIKLRRSVLLPACIVIPVIPAVMGTYNYLQNLGILKGEWYSLWTQHTLFYACFFYAPLIALYCSWLWRLEHRNNNWYVFMSAPVSVSSLYLGKLAVIFRITLITQLWVGMLFFICGKIAGLPGIFPPQIFFWLLRGTLAAISIGALQLLLSMVIKSFSIPIAIALAGGVIGMLSTSFGENIGLLWPYSLMLMGMNSNKETDILTGGTIPFLCSTLAFFLLFYLIAVWLLKKRDAA